MCLQRRNTHKARKLKGEFISALRLEQIEFYRARLIRERSDQKTQLSLDVGKRKTRRRKILRLDFAP